MSFLGWPVEDTQCSPQLQKRRKQIAFGLVEKFQRVFPEITYEFIWKSSTINAQAWRLGSRRYVRVYGGLLRHPTVTRAGLAVILAHETGHHLGGLPRDPDMPWMTWQGQADYWAGTIGMPKVFGPKALNLTLQGACEIRQLHLTLAAQFENDEPDLAIECRYAIFLSAAFGREMPACAKAAFWQVARCGDYEWPLSSW
jgi:hypothetical protein